MRAPALLLAAVVASGCTMGPNPDTIIDELRVVAAVAEQPEVSPGETTALDVVVADPQHLGPDVLVWTCTPGPDGCLESSLPVETWLDVGVIEGHRLTTSLTAPASLSAVLQDDATLPVPVWLLACEPGLCPVLDEATAALDAGGPAPASLAHTLADPFSWMAELPIDGVSLATRTLHVSNAPPQDRNQNPVLSVDVGPRVVATPSADLSLPVSVQDDTDAVDLAFGLATRGGFGLPAFDVLDGRAELTWYAPDESGTADLFVVVDDGEGGSAVWIGEAVVE